MMMLLAPSTAGLTLGYQLPLQVINCPRGRVRILPGQLTLRDFCVPTGKIGLPEMASRGSIRLRVRAVSGWAC